jgi:WD40 repeat protein
MSRSTGVKTILILAANPAGTSRLQLDKEIREIDEGLKRGNKREQFKLEQKWAVRQRDFYRAILDYQPQIVHFSGHGASVDGIVLENEADEPAFLNADALASMFELFATKGVECVLLNACYSEVQAKAISQHVNYVIGMNRTIGDKAARAFSVAFYDAIAAGQQMEFAYKLGRSVLMNYLEQQTPVLLKKDPLGTVQPLFDIVPPNPYVGLAAFTEVDAAFFFGRETFVNGLVEAVNQQPLVGVIGPSGSGKSSVVYAGLFPQLRIAGNWLIESFRPGDKPFYQLASVLVRLLEPETGETAQLREAVGLAVDMELGTITLPTVISRLNERHSSKRLLLFADQFEELYTLCQNKEVIERFVDALLTAIHLDNFTLVFTLRADFYSFVLGYRSFRDALEQFTPKLLSSMNREECKRAIEQPAQKMVVQLEAQLTERILDDVGNEPGNLPLLEFALTRLWSLQQKRKLTHQAYDQIGGVKKALANHAEQVYQQLNETQQKIVARIFVQLVRPGVGTEDTRRIATRAEVGDENWRLVSYLAGYPARLVVTGHDEKSLEDTVEVVHEALIREWLTLHEWMKKDRLFRAWQERLRDNIHQWSETKQDEGALLRGVPLSEAEEKLKERREELSPSEQNFIQLSIEQRDQLRQLEEERRQRELETETRARKAAQTRSRVTVSASVIVLGFAIFAGYQWRLAEIQQIQALLQSSEANLNSSNGLEARLASLAAGKILKHSWWQVTIPEIGLKNQILGELSQTINNAGAEFNRLEGHTGLVWSVVFSPDGKLLATGGDDGTARLWDTSGKQLALLKGHTGLVRSVVFSPDGKLLATSGEDRTARLWDTSGKQLALLKGHTSWITSVVFSPDGERVATGGLDGTARLWDTSGKQLALLKGHQRSVMSVVFSPDGKLLATGGFDGTARLWDTSGKQLALLKGHQRSVTSVVFSPDGERVATGGFDGTARLWDTSGKQLALLKGHTGLVWSVVFSPDGKLLATGGLDGTARLWDTSGKQLALLKGHIGSVRSVVFSPDGKLLATSGDDGTARLWDTSSKQLALLKGHQRSVISVVFSPDGKLLATGGDDGTARLWDTSGKQLALLKGHIGLVRSVVFSPDGKLLATGGDDGTARLWDTSGKQLAFLKGHQRSVRSVVFSPNGKLLATGGLDGTARLWDTSGKQLALLKGHTSWITSVVFSPDGKLLATGGLDGTARLWDTSGKQLALLKGHTGLVTSVVFSPDGKLLATGEDDGTARLWDTSGKQLALFKGHIGSVNSVVFSPDGKLLATGGVDGTARLWDTSGKQLALLKGHTSSITSVVFSPDGKLLSTGADDGTARLWQVGGMDRLFAVNCDWMRNYLKNDPNVKESDKYLCDGIGTYTNSL